MADRPGTFRRDRVAAVTLRVENMGGLKVLFFPEDGSLLTDPGQVNDFISDAWSHEAKVVVLPVVRISSDFLKLSTRLAGEVIQKFANYRILLVILGDTSIQSAQSNALRDFIYESNRGQAVWFLPDEEVLRQRMGYKPHVM